MHIIAELVWKLNVSRVENYFLNLFSFLYGLQLILVTNNALDNGKL